MSALLNEQSTNPRVAVLLAVFDGANWLKEQLDSILGQVKVDITIFVSVDQSSDGSEQLIDCWASLDPRIKALQHGFHFGGAAPNFLRLMHEVDFSTFDFVSLADQDDIWNNNKLNAAIELLRSKDASAYSSNALAFWGNGRTAFINKSQAQVKWDYLFEAAGPGCTYVLTQQLATSIQQLLVQKPQALKKVGFHDWFFYAYARAHEFKWVIDDQSWISYRQHASNQVGINSGLQAFMHRVDKVSSGWALAQSIFVADLLDKKSEPFAKMWSSGNPLGLARLACYSWQCRRRFRDKFFFFFACIYMALKGGISSSNKD